MYLVVSTHIKSVLPENVVPVILANWPSLFKVNCQMLQSP